MSVGAEATPAVPGTGGDTGTVATPPAGVSNTDTGGGGTPETVPYSRFKEVNDQLGELKSYSQLAEMGYDADSLASLAGFEATYLAQPHAVLAQLVDGLSDLPDDAKAAIKDHLGVPDSSASTPPPAGQNGNEGANTDEPPEWAKPLIADYSDRQRQGEAADRAAKIDEIIRLWNDADAKDGIKTPERTQLAYIAVNAPHGNGTAEIAEMARRDWIEARTEALGESRSAVRDTFAAGAPKPVPGSAGVAAIPNAPKTLAEASQAIKAAIAAGQTLTREGS